MKKRILLSIASLLSLLYTANANNIQVANVFLGAQVTAGAQATHHTSINFDVQWDNSWRTSNNESNYDGCWLFAKYRKLGTSLWKHASLNYVSPGTAVACGHTEASGSTIKQSADGKGVWLYRDADGIGNVAFAGNTLRWNYGADVYWITIV
jgi:hypothetical protein